MDKPKYEFYEKASLEAEDEVPNVQEELKKFQEQERKLRRE